MLPESPMEAFMNLLAQPIRFIFSFIAFLGRPGPGALLLLEQDTDLERYLFCRDLRFSSGPPCK